MDNSLLNAWNELEDMRRCANALLKEIGAIQGPIAEQLVEEFAAAGMQAVKRTEGTTYLHRSLFAGPADGDKDRMISALQGNDLGFLVKTGVDGRSLSSYIREVEEGLEEGQTLEDALPAEVWDAITTAEVHRIRRRKN